MAAQKGREVIVKIGDGESPQNYVTVGGARSGTFSFSEDGVDVTDKDSPERWREMIRGGVRTAEISLAGVLKDSAAETTLLNQAFSASGGPEEYQFIVPDFFTFEGLFICTSYELSGEHDGAAEYSATFQSAGQITETAA